MGFLGSLSTASGRRQFFADVNWESRFCDCISFKKFTDLFRSTSFDRFYILLINGFE